MASLESRKRRLLLHDLPKTFREAIEVTRRLGVQYLWIDALCIVQDSMEDWEYESSRMAQIFQDSLLTLAAADAATPFEGLFRERMRHRSRPYILEPRVSYKHRHELGPGPLSIWPEKKQKGTARKPASVLDSRGWVLQEQLLSKRLLTYSKGGLFWDCVSMNGSESYPEGLLIHIDYKWEDRDLQVFKEYVNAKNNSMSKSALGRLWISWQQVLELYSSRMLSHEKDRLVALQGISNVLEKSTGSGLVYGLWVGNLVRDLFWRAIPKKDLPMSRLGWRAPSWSWASIDAPVSANWYEIYGRKEIPKLLAEARPGPGFQNAKASPVPKFARQLQISGMLIKATLRSNEEENLFLEVQEGGTFSQASFYPDLRSAILGDVWCLHLLQFGEVIGGLCLLHEGSGVANEYERVGVYTMSFDKKTDARRADSPRTVATLL